MLKRFRNLNVILTAIMIVSAFVLVANVISGQASTNSGSQVKGIGAIELSSSEVVISEYRLMESDPSRIDSIRLEVKDARIDKAATVLVTVDGGENWASCKSVEGTTWMCSYPEMEAPQVSEVQNIEIIVNG